MLTWLLGLSLSLGARATATWPQLAERMTGESDQVRERCLSELKAMPHLDQLLKAELREPTQPSRTHMYLALDIIAALKLRELLPDLIELSESEPSGYLYQTINTLVTPQNRAAITELYRQRLSGARTQPAARMALIDTLARFGAAIEASELEQLLRDSSVDVRQAALSYARTFLIRGLQPNYLPLVREQLKRGTFLLRVQAVFLLRDLQHGRLPLGNWRETCRGDASDAVRALCIEKSGVKT